METWSALTGAVGFRLYGERTVVFYTERDINAGMMSETIR